MELYIYPSWVKVFAEPYIIMELREFLSIDVPRAKYTDAFKKKKWDGKKRFYNYRKQIFPIGFLNRVKKEFAGDITGITDARMYQPLTFMVPHLFGLDMDDERRMYQKEAMLCCFEAKNCLIEAATNAGKSAVMAGLCRILRIEKVIILVHRLEIFEQLLDCVFNAMPSVPKGTLDAILKLSCRDWEKEKVRPINEFRFIHANERMKAFDEILVQFFLRFREVLADSLNAETVSFLRNAALTNFKDFLEAEGYVVDYLP